MSYNPADGGSQYSTSQAFRQARWQAIMEQMRARFTGRPVALLCYWEVEDLVMSTALLKLGIQEIRLDRIVGSVERCGDFTRGFLPLHDWDQQRWTAIRALLTQARRLPPILVHQVGEVYFVLDGNHRVSVARQIGLTHLPANVVQIQTRVPVSAEDQSSDLRLKGEYARFLQRTGLDESRPEADLRLTVLGRFEVIERQIEGHRSFLALDHRHQIAFAEAATNWYDNVYLPVVRAIRDQNLLLDFAGWTEADLYLALCDHRLALEAAVGHLIELELAAVDLARQLQPPKGGWLARLVHTLPRVLRSGAA